MKKPFDDILPELWEEIYLYLDDVKPYEYRIMECDCSQFERTCLFFRELCIRMERRKLKEQLELESKYLKCPLLQLSTNQSNNGQLSSSSQQGVKEEDIQLVEERLGRKFPFHLREFIKLVDGRPAYSKNSSNLHYSNSLLPFKSWKISIYGNIMIGGVFDEYEPTEIYLDIKSGQMSMDISTYGTTDGIYGGCKGYLKMTSNIYDNYNPFDTDKLSENFTDLLKICSVYSNVIDELPEKLANNLEIMKKLALANPISLYRMPPSLKDDINLVRKLIMKRPRSYVHVSDRLKKDRALFDLAFSLDANNFSAADNSFKDREKALKYCKTAPYPSVNDFPADLASEVVFHFNNFWNVPPELLTSELVIHFLEKNDYEVKREIERNPALQTREVLEAIFHLCPTFLFKLKKEHLFTFETKEVFLKLLQSEHAVTVFSMLPQELKHDVDLIRMALKSNFEIFKCLSEELRQDREFILSIWNETKSVDFILRPDFAPYNKDLEFLKIACNKNSRIVFSIDSDLVTEDFLNSLQHYSYPKSLIGDLLTMTRFEHYQNYKIQNKE